ncbi:MULTISPECIES: hypothetical protein [Nocardiaceae]|nr:MULTISPECIES: hypothetical protein [Rhodococcus]
MHPQGDVLSADYDPDAPLFPGRHTRASAVPQASTYATRLRCAGGTRP